MQAPAKGSIALASGTYLEGAKRLSIEAMQRKQKRAGLNSQQTERLKLMRMNRATTPHSGRQLQQLKQFKTKNTILLRDPNSLSQKYDETENADGLTSDGRKLSVAIPNGIRITPVEVKIAAAFNSSTGSTHLTNINISPTFGTQATRESGRHKNQSRLSGDTPGEYAGLHNAVPGVSPRPRNVQFDEQPSAKSKRQ